MFKTKLTRRAVLAAAMGGITLPAFRASAQGMPPGSKGKPNIVFIMADDLGYADVSCYGRPDYETPAIDRLAAEGMRFTQAYANSAVCSATRVGLITGRYQNRLPIGLEEPLDRRNVGLPPKHPTLPSLLKQAGYGTTLVGKWHLGALPDYGPLKSGYDHFWGFRGGGVDYFSHTTHSGKHDLWDDDREIEQPGYITDLLGQRTTETIERYVATRQPFFISLHFNAPHWPWEGPKDEAESRRLAASKKPFAIFDADGGSQKTFAAMVTRMDLQIGHVLATLERLRIADNTIVILTSDNGGERYSNTWPFTGRKTELLEGGLRIPAIVRWPRLVPAGTVNEQVMISMDWLPTLLAIAGGRADPAFPPDGIDLSESLLHAAPSRQRTLCWRYLNLAQEACRVGDWKYLKILDNTFLFNVVEDPLERANLKDRRPDIYQRLHAAWTKWNDQMLPLDAEATTSGFTGADAADHFGITRSRTLKLP